MDIQFEVGQAIKFHRNGKKCRGVVRGVQLSIADTGVEDYLIVLRRKQTIEVKISDVIQNDFVEQES